ncbi:peptide chain release factor N(5)-glutamine methyltransferase [Aliamphritea spongicola]|uniref:peptide chain release factor N(5)-glutamine methyltransferase n=1 Tax=Aliamphritea spongicola TaxID=707589 RepID=UPI00196A2C9E|nr:peptide chain release factor N(5)-glutamine methyltransferase [Aliamphritea spongicola]MBN3562592.1 peptide chain release factor N(5)-glutamine methyltransferase [Aliamphritea spongicola]
MPDIRQALQRSVDLDALSESARLDIELLLCHVIDKSRTYLMMHPGAELSADQQVQFEALLQRRINGEPVAHILEQWSFWNFDLAVNASTLIPRPDTECVVEKALELLPPGPAKVADLGTGTGAIALALATERPAWQVFAVDFVADAAELAEQNRQTLGLSNVTVLQGSWLEPVSEELHMVVSNPPYIDPEDPHLKQGDVRFEPLSALVADDHGLADIRTISAQAWEQLSNEGWLLFEHGYDQAAAVQNILREQGYSQVASAQDLAGNDRMTWGRKLLVL